MRYLKPYLLLILFSLPIISFAQERGVPTYYDYLTDNYYLIHPSMAGAGINNKIRLTARRQWFDVEDAPSLETITINGRIGESNIGVGAIIYNDNNGRFSQQGAMATFAYHLLLSRDRVDLNQLSFGLNVGVVQEGLDESDLIGGTNPNDPNITGGNNSESVFNVDFGMSYFFLDFYAHFTAKNIVPTPRRIFTELESENQRQYLLSLGYVFSQYNSDWSFEPSVMFQTKEETGESAIDGNFKVYRELDFGQIWGGLSYRRSLDGAEFTEDGLGTVESQKLQHFSPFVGINFNKFMFAYTYTHQVNSVILSNGFHQITLGYNFGGSKEPYHCNCPAINY